MWIDIRGPIVANTAYCGGKLVAKDVAITLPEVSFKTSTFPAMGDVEMAVPGNINAMELSITKIGVDMGLSTIVKLESKIIEVRFVHDVKKADGTTKVEGCKAFLRSSPKGIPGIGLAIGSNTENEITAGVTRYQLYAGGEELWLIDQLNSIMRIGGTDYMKSINSLL
ncbi:MAG: phage major tail tube protein [Clostridiaceae bacterium]|nr:phage major tail tube protein [Clostridiaceae bacterium]DAM37302.1 MAG TPA: major tail protein [Caudoviricetes sp.]